MIFKLALLYIILKLKPRSISYLINNLNKTNKKIYCLSLFIFLGKIHCLHRYVDLFQRKKNARARSLNVPVEKFFTHEDVTITGEVFQIQTYAELCGHRTERVLQLATPAVSQNLGFYGFVSNTLDIHTCCSAVLQWSCHLNLELRLTYVAVRIRNSGCERSTTTSG